MSRLSQQPLALHQQTHLPSRPPLLTIPILKDDSVQQTPSSDLSDERGVEGLDGGSEMLAETVCAGGQVFVDQDVEGGDGYCSAEWVSGRRKRGEMIVSLEARTIRDEMGRRRCWE